MKHGDKFRKLSRSGAHRRALFRNQVTSLIEHERIETTLPKAKELRRIFDRMITLGKCGTLRARRKVNGFVTTRAAAKKVFVELAPRFEDRPCGYTRVLRTRHRRGDCAPMAMIELSDTENTILTPEQLEYKEMRKSKHRQVLIVPGGPSRGLADALDST